MKLISLPCKPDVLLSHLRYATEIDTVEKNQKSRKEAVFYSHVRENTFDLYERPAFVKEKTVYLGGVYLRGAVAEEGDGCAVASEPARIGDNIRNDVIAAVLFVLSLGGTILSGNIFATMLPILVLISGGFLIADGVACILQARRIKKKWASILSSIEPDYAREMAGL